MAITFNHLDQRVEYRRALPGLEVLSKQDYELAVRLLVTARPADLVIAPEGAPYLYRWFLQPRNSIAGGNLYLHIQVASDPERPLHDHPWDNVSHILSGGYDEILAEVQANGELGEAETISRYPGDIIARSARTAHRLLLPPETRYTMTMFMTGPKTREWGFWYPDGWVHNAEVVRMREDGASIHVQRTRSN